MPYPVLQESVSYTR